MNNPHVRGVAASLPPERAQIVLGATRREI